MGHSRQVIYAAAVLVLSAGLTIAQSEGEALPQKSTGELSPQTQSSARIVENQPIPKSTDLKSMLSNTVPGRPASDDSVPSKGESSRQFSRDELSRVRIENGRPVLQQSTPVPSTSVVREGVGSMSPDGPTSNRAPANIERVKPGSTPDFREPAPKPIIDVNVKVPTAKPSQFVEPVLPKVGAIPPVSNGLLDPEASGGKTVTGIPGGCPGDESSSPRAITAIPFYEGGSTIGCNDDYDEQCPFNTPGSPDVVYAYTPGADGAIEIDLCASLYDTKVYVYENAITPGSPLRCNDDYCGVDGYRSFIPCFPVTAGSTYLIVVDGYGGASGDYVLSVYSCTYGDRIESAFEIPSVPYTDAKSTAGFNHDYDEVCPGVNPGAADLVYKYTPPLDVNVEIDLCASNYDTKVYVYEGFYNPGAALRCNDDACGVDGWRSYLPCFRMTRGVTYYIVIDGWGPSDQGDFLLDIRVCPSPCPEWTGCSPYAIPEGEPCGNLPDEYNGGCNSFPPVFTPIAPFQSYCGDVWWDGSTRDTDWYLASLPYGDSVTVCFRTSFSAAFFVMFADEGCGSQEILFYWETGAACDSVCFTLRAAEAGDFYFFVAPSFGSPVLACDQGPWPYEISLYRHCPPCASELAEGETCRAPFELDDFNDPCNGISAGMSPIISDHAICGTSSSYGYYVDYDWYGSRYFYAGDSITLSLQTAFPIIGYIVDFTAGCLGLNVVAGGSTSGCGSVDIGWRVPADGDYAFVVLPNSPLSLTCDLGPWSYSILLREERACWITCAPDAIIEGEGCAETTTDSYNGGCNSIPPVYLPIAIGDAYCGESWYSNSLGNRDTDWYKTLIPAGQTVEWCVQAEFDFVVAIINLDIACGDAGVVAFANVPACDWGILSYTPLEDANLAFFVAPAFAADRLCADPTAPWTYSAFLGTPACDWAGCGAPDIIESEPCAEDIDIVNGGCNYLPYRFTPIQSGELICGETYYGLGMRDLDWYSMNLTAGRIVSFDVSARASSGIFIVDVTSGCGTYAILETGETGNCGMASIAATAVNSGLHAFVVTNPFGNRPLLCEKGPWLYEAVVTTCGCDCAHDPECNGVTNLNDVVHVVNVAFRGGDQIPDPNPMCPRQTTDVNCDGVTNLNDVVRFVNVAFRGGDPTDQFCDPCAPVSGG